MAAHLTLADRLYLQRLVSAKKSKAEMARLMNRHRSTIYRELDRNCDPLGYHPDRADWLAKRRRRAVMLVEERPLRGPATRAADAVTKPAE